MLTRRVGGFVLLAGLSLAPAAVAQDRTRVDLYDARSRRQGYVIIDESSGRLDVYDNHSRRLGFGRITPDGRLERFDRDGRREGAAIVLPRRR